MASVSYPIRYRKFPHGPVEHAAFSAECHALLARATELDAAQQALAVELADVRTKLAELRVVMWPRIDRKDIVHGFRHTRRGGPPPIPPATPNALPLWGRHLRSATLAILARRAEPMTLPDIHRELHLNGYAIKSRDPVKRLADCLSYESTQGRARHVDRGIYALGALSPAVRRRIGCIPLARAA